ncbi:cytochrome P450 [Mollisia scopiformis]|uniref:Cytochrome P450 n=1 Tax=Mollisia scopiformis TaxID=149040 RepID=A0A194XSV7_MOLSC|nr:cytochrome P450 [Mollisia scopiformis]KUJ23226.1 cytochrome P450 [Mollisia scopiformis]
MSTISSFFGNMTLPSPAAFSMGEAATKGNLGGGLDFLLEKMESRPFQITTSVLSVVLLYFVFGLFSPQKMKATPYVGKESDPSFHGALKEGYSKFKDSLFKIPAPHHTVHIIPPKFMNEVKNLPDTKLSFQGQVKDRFSGQYTGLGVNDVLVNAVKVDVTKNMDHIIKEFEDEMPFALNTTFGELKDWTEIPFYHKGAEIVGYVAGRIFVGHPLGRNDKWQPLTIQSMASLATSDELWEYPEMFHGLVHYFLSHVKAVKQYLVDGAKVLTPIVESRRKVAASGTKGPKPADMTQWIMDQSSEKDRYDVAHIVETQMMGSVVAIHTTAMAISQVMYDLIQYPEHIAPLREEWKRVLGEHNGQFNKSSLSQLEKLDSFLKESQRHKPTGSITLNRRINQEIKLSNGIVLEKGIHVGVASAALGFDPEIYPDPHKFDGFRFYKLRQIPGNEKKWHFATAAGDQLFWGYGKDACPGRFFASNLMKIMTIEFLEKYDFQFRDGVRPPDVIRDFRTIPNPVFPILMKSRKA